jgi:hypothetical protein
MVTLTTWADWRPLLTTRHGPQNFYRFCDEDEQIVKMNVNGFDGVYYTMFPSSALDIISKNTWHVRKGRTGILYVRSEPKKGGIYIHQHVLQKVDLIDHLDGNGLDNRLENLVESNSVDNSNNMKMNIKNTSGVNGICDLVGIESLVFAWYEDSVRHVKAIKYNLQGVRGYKRTRDEAWNELIEFRDGVVARTGSNNGKRSKIVDYDRFKLTQEELDLITKKQRFKGVCDNPKESRFTASSRHGGRRSCKRFSYCASSGVKKDEAFANACEWRREMESIHLIDDTTTIPK